ncbi:MAG: biopolymer transporter ExbD [Sheuella sp.]|jgi:biopolymer transport protein ExbD|nr:biopolymer transporter ExbD [Sheuella sp.]
MRFRQNNPDDSPEINLIPLIDVLLVMLIFLAATTTFTRQGVLKIMLPRADAEKQIQTTIDITISQDGRYAVGDRLVDGSDSLSLTEALREAKKDQPDPIVIIYADAMAAHQSVMTAMQAARTAGIGKVHFATQAID